jgi:hypothetical protein
MTFLAVDEGGVYVAWQQKNPTTGADVVVSRSKTNGATWETPVRPHAPFGHQIFPYLAAAGARLSIAWYDSRSGPAFNPNGPVTGQCPTGAMTGADCTGMDVFYAQARTDAPSMRGRATRTSISRRFRGRASLPLAKHFLFFEAACFGEFSSGRCRVSESLMRLSEQKMPRRTLRIRGHGALEMIERA